jgi:hypothetical protein
MILPLLLIKIVIRVFTRELLIEFKEDSFSIDILDKNREEVNNLEYDLKDICAYSVQFPNRRFCSIKFYFKSKTSKSYSFFREKLYDDQMDSEKLIELFQSQIKTYNRGVLPSERIIFEPSFWASSRGFAYIAGLVILLTLAICLHFLLASKTAPISLFFGFSLITQLILKRRADINFYRNMKD